MEHPASTNRDKVKSQGFREHPQSIPNLLYCGQARAAVLNTRLVGSVQVLTVAS